MRSNPLAIRQAMDEYEAAKGSYIDVHAWQFTPESFESNVNALSQLGLIRLHAEQIYPTKQGHNEFCAVLRGQSG